MKSNSVITHEVERTGGGQLIKFNVVGVGILQLSTASLSPEVFEKAAVHGMVQRISDAAAIGRNPDTGRSATPQEKFDAMAKLVAHYESGTSEWSRVRESGEGSNRGQLFRALGIIYPQRTPEQIRAWMDKQTKEQLSAVRKSQKVRDAIATFTDGSEGDAILSELE